MSANKIEKLNLYKQDNKKDVGYFDNDYSNTVAVKKKSTIFFNNDCQKVNRITKGA